MAQKWLQQLQASNAENAINVQSEYKDIDADGDGKLTAKELALTCNITILEAEELIEQYDANGDGTLDEQEFQELKQQILSQQRNNMTDKININNNYDQFDKDGDGRLDANELSQACGITVQEAQNIIYQYDANGDGTLDANEFEDLKQQILSQQRDNMAQTLSNNQQYADMDVNNDGQLSAAELATACNITELEAQNIIYQYDVNGDGMLDANEFEDLKQQILSQQEDMMEEQQEDNNPFDEQVEEKQVMPSGVSINEDVAAYQSAVYDNNQPQMAINNRDNSNSTFVPYNQQNNAPEFSGNINKVDESEYSANNSNAKAFGVDIFANENNNKLVYNNTNSLNETNANEINTNGSPFGKKQTDSYNNQSNVNESPFGQKTESPFGKKNDSSFGKKTESPFGKKHSPFGQKPVDEYNKEPEPIISKNSKPRYKHQWVLAIKFDVKKEEIILNVSDDTTGKKWRKIVTKHDYNGEMKQEYFRLGNIINRGNAKYTAPSNDIGAVQVELSKGDNKYNFYAQPI